MHFNVVTSELVINEIKCIQTSGHIIIMLLSKNSMFSIVCA